MSEPVEGALGGGLEASLASLIQDSEVNEVRFEKYCGELLSPGPPPSVCELDLQIAASYRLRDQGFDCRYEAKAPLRANDGSTIVDIDIAVVASFSHKGDQAPDRETLSAFMDRVAYFVAMPFIREAVQALSVRLGLDALTLGLLGKGRDSPTRATKRARTRRREEASP